MMLFDGGTMNGLEEGKTLWEFHSSAKKEISIYPMNCHTL